MRRVAVGLNTFRPSLVPSLPDVLTSKFRFSVTNNKVAVGAGVVRFGEGLEWRRRWFSGRFLDRRPASRCWST